MLIPLWQGCRTRVTGGSVMDLSSLSSTRYVERAFNPVPYRQAPLPEPGTSINPPGASPLPGSNWPAENAVWVSQSKEEAALEKIHVSEIGQRMLGKMAAVWEIQSLLVKRLQDEQNSMERAVVASRFLTQNAINSLIALEQSLDVAGRSIDIYA